MKDLRKSARRALFSRLLILLIIGASGNLYAAETAASDPNAALASNSTTAPVAGDGQVPLRKGDILRGHFTEDRTLKGFTAPLHSEGHFSVVPGTGIIWASTKPFDVEVVFTSKGMVQLSDGQPMMKVSATETPFMSRLFDMLADVLAGNTDSLDQSFKIERSDIKDHWKVILTPKDTDNAAMPFASIRVVGTEFVDTVELKKTDGDTDVITFDNKALTHGIPTDAEAKAFSAVGP